MMVTEKITPYRMVQLVKVASKATDLMVNGVWSLSFEEMDIVLSLIRCGMDESRKMKEEGHVSEDIGTEKDDEVSA